MNKKDFLIKQFLERKYNCLTDLKMEVLDTLSLFPINWGHIGNCIENMNNIIVDVIDILKITDCKYLIQVEDVYNKIKQLNTDDIDVLLDYIDYIDIAILCFLKEVSYGNF